ncbi:Thiol-disulfide oxidoreductase ResA [Nymphon striatum]|nr:Thiol-disulfide oxidoreductase ResA [Nymphon striatum]
MAVKSRLFQEILHGGVVKNSPAGGAMTHLKNQLYANKKIADKYNLEMVAYEGGQHLIRYDPPHTVKDPKVLNLFMSAQKDPRMKQAYQRYLETWAQSGGGLMMHFFGIGEPEPKSFFGMLDHLHQPSTPKYQALMDYLGSNVSYVPPRKAYVPPPAAPVQRAPVTRTPPAVAPPRTQQPVVQRPPVRQQSVVKQQTAPPAGDYGWDAFLSDGIPAAAAPDAAPQRQQHQQQTQQPVSSGRPISGRAVNGWVMRGNTATSPPINLKRGVNHNFSVLWHFQNVRNTGHEQFRIYSIDQKGGRKVLLQQTARDINEVRDFEQIFEDNFNRYVGPPIRIMLELAEVTVMLYKTLIAILLLVIMAVAGWYFFEPEDSSVPPAKQQKVEEQAKTSKPQSRSELLTALPDKPFAPTFELTDDNGDTHSLSDFRGKPIIINFWATWCPPLPR